MTTTGACLPARRHLLGVFNKHGMHWFALPCLLLLLLTALCYWETLNVFFVQDDFGCLAVAGQPMPNARMLRGFCFFRPLSTYWLPLLNMSVFGLRPFWHHFTYLLLFLATVGALYYWLQGLTRSTPAALAGAALYAFSKTHLYTLAWIAGGIDVSAALFLVLGLWAADVYMKRADEGDALAGRRMMWIVGVVFLCGLLCKESCIVFAPACLAWIAARKFAGRRPFAPYEWKLAVVLIAIVAVYLPTWKLISITSGDPAGEMQLDLLRGKTVLEDSVIAVLPAAINSIPRSSWWLSIAPALAAVAIVLRRKGGRIGEYVVWGLSLWVLPAAIFAFTKYPWVLQLYYAHFSVIGLSLLAALAVGALHNRLLSPHAREYPTAMRIRYWPKLASGAAVLAFAAWVGFAGWTIRSGVRNRASPALHEADYSRYAYEKIAPHLDNSQYRKIVFLGLSDKMWASIYYGNMVRVYFPGVDVDHDRSGRADISEDIKTSSTVLVVRQTGDKALTVVR
ncbi:MAG: hypothetical protein JW959_09835 [Pirellulales bacterium]|nr:hypothetical protein [Pirellulales bacterium]